MHGRTSHEQIQSLVQADHCNVRHYAPSLYVDEILQRFKLDVIEDQNALEGASDDRVRAEFRVHVPLRFALHSNRTKTRIPASSNLANLLDVEDTMHDWPAFKNQNVKVVDGYRERPPVHTRPGPVIGVSFTAPLIIS
ncbi:hypothetical protein BBP40_006430 [Aspergillus hancockii]|nr:hypothetical protein BBP40_006430 [Aspergillus hancockii]